MFASVLIANRGEIACRIIRTARRLGIRSIAIFSEADRGALHARLADEAHEIGPAAARESYLAGGRIIALARRVGANCIHPGYGFLSENAEFAEGCAAAGVTFVGPPPAAIRAMGLKGAAKALMQKAGVPVVPGYHGDEQAPAFLREKAGEIGYPVLIKAIAGGGGKGMRRVDAAVDFESALEGAAREAQGAFGDPRVLIEKYVARPRHIEMQIFGDARGDVVHLFERDCSLQRRHQKVIEESPAPGLSEPMRAIVSAAAVAAGKAIGYVGAGTVEFIADSSRGLRPDGFFFMEMNTRLQVEHPVTEAITGLDLVEWQFLVAAGQPLPLKQNEIRRDGHAVEARLYAEDPEHGFLPAAGRIHALRLPRGEGIRVDAGVEAGGEVTPFYDPMIAKIIAHAASRDEAIDRLGQALAETLVAGPRTNAPLLSALCEAPEFRAGAIDAGFIEANLARLGAAPREVDADAVLAGAERLLAPPAFRWSLPSPQPLLGDREAIVRRKRARGFSLRPLAGEGGPTKSGRMRADSDSGESQHALAPKTGAAAIDPWRVADSFELTGRRSVGVEILADGRPVSLSQIIIDGVATLEWADHRRAAGEAPAAAPATIVEADGAAFVLRRGRQTELRRIDPLDFEAEAAGDESGQVEAPMHGRLVALLAREGEIVKRGARLAIVEAMKMEHSLTAPRAGRVARIAAVVGAQVRQGARLMIIEDVEE